MHSSHGYTLSVPPSPRDLQRFLKRLEQALAADAVRVSTYARQRAFDELQFDALDILLVVGELDAESFEKCVLSEVSHDELVWVFCPTVDDTILWIRLIERNGILVVSFHPG